MEGWKEATFSLFISLKRQEEPTPQPTVVFACVFSCSVVSNSLRLWTVACQPPLSWGFPGKVFLAFQVRRGLPFPFPGDLLDPRLNPVSTALAGKLFTAEPPGEPMVSQNSLSFPCLLHPAVTPSRTPPWPSTAAPLPTSDLRVDSHSLPPLCFYHGNELHLQFHLFSFIDAHIYLFLAVSSLALCPEAGRSSCCSAWAPLVVTCGLGCPMACGILVPWPGTLVPLHWMVDSQPLDHQGSPQFCLFSHGLVQISSLHSKGGPSPWLSSFCGACFLVSTSQLCSQHGTPLRKAQLSAGGRVGGAGRANDKALVTRW